MTELPQNALAYRPRSPHSRAMKKTTVHLCGDSGNRGTYCGWLLNDERRSNLTIRPERNGQLPPLASWEKWCGSCLRVRKADLRYHANEPIAFAAWLGSWDGALSPPRPLLSTRQLT